MGPFSSYLSNIAIFHWKSTPMDETCVQKVYPKRVGVGKDFLCWKIQDDPTHRRVPSLKLTAKAPENKPKRHKRKREEKNPTIHF